MLKFLLSSRHVQHFELQQRERRFAVFMAINANGDSPAQPAMLVTSRRKDTPRTWASIDSFLDYLRVRAETPPEIRITCNQGGTNGKKTKGR